MAAASFAHTYTVNDAGDTSDATPGDNSCADDAAKCTLRAAIQEANADTGASVINIPSGMTITLTNGPLDDITNSVQINGTGATVDANDGEAFYITAGTGAVPAVGITGLTITGDSGSSSDSAVYVYSGGLTLTGVTIKGNDLTTSSVDGAGVYVDYDGSLWMFGSSVTGNKGYDGGGIYNDGAAYISNSHIDSNLATEYGGGLYNDGNVILENTTVNGNHVSAVNGYAGGVYNDELLQVTGGSIDGNVLDNSGSGAGLGNEYIAQIANASVSNNSIAEGTGDGGAYGAAIYDEGYALNLDTVTLAGNNTAMTQGEDIYGTALYLAGAAATISNSTISGTTADGSAGNSYIEGGAVYVDTGAGQVHLSGTTISGTTAKAGTNGVYGGAISVETGTDLSNVTIKDTSNSGDWVEGGAVALYDDDSGPGYESAVNGLNVSNTSNHTVNTEYGEIDGGAVYLEAYSNFNQVSIDGTNNLADVAADATAGTPTWIFGGAIDDYAYNGCSDGCGYEKTWSTVSATHTTSKAVGGNGYVQGGVIDNQEGLNVTDTQIVGAVVQADYAIEGGALYNYDNFQADRFTVSNILATVLGGDNTSDTPYLDGAALYDYYMTTFLNSTVANVLGSAPSTASEALGIYNDDESTLTNVTMANNATSGPADNTFWLFNDSSYETKLINSIVSTTTPATNCGGPGTVTSAGYNIDNGASCGFTNAGDQQNTDPKVANAADNGGLVHTAALLVGSPAINAGDNSKCPATDERGVNRPVLGTCDIGAYEYNLDGYRFAASDGGVFSFGPGAQFYGSTGGVKLVSPIVGMASDPATGGYWLVAADGGVFAFHAPFYGSMGGKHLNQPIVGISAAPGGTGYRLVAKDGGIFSFGKGAPFYGSTGNVKLVSPIVGMATDQVTGGYWMVAADGGIFAFHAPFFGSTAKVKLAQPIVGMAPAPFGQGYWLVAKDGGIFAFGPSAHFYGSTGGVKLVKPIVAIAADDVTGGYWMVAADGGVFAFHAPFYGSTGGVKLVKPIVAAAAAS